MPTVTAYFDDEFLTHAKRYAKRGYRSMSAFIRMCVESWIRRDMYVMPIEEIEKAILEEERNQPPWQKEYIMEKYRRQQKDVPCRKLTPEEFRAIVDPQPSKEVPHDAL